jgi:RNA polymerase sigma-70 factor (sigma-E family)
VSRDEEFRAYVGERRGGLLRTATFLTSGDRHAAEDLVQTALMRLYVAWTRVRPETVDAYARKAMLNALIDNRRRPFARFERSRAEVPDVAAEQPPATERESAVFAALAALPPRMRAAVVLRHLVGLSVAEAADALNCSEGTVKSQTARALMQLRTALTPAVLSPGAADDVSAGVGTARSHTTGSCTTGLPTGASAPVDLRHADEPVRTPDLGGTDE